MFKTFDSSYALKVEFGNGEFVDVKKKREVTVMTPLGFKFIWDVLYMSLID